MGKYHVLTPVQHDGKLYLFGDAVELTDAQASALLRGNAIQEDKPDFMTEAQHESHKAAKTVGELFEIKTEELAAERAAGVAAEAQHEADVAQATANAAAVAAKAHAEGSPVDTAPAAKPADAEGNGPTKVPVQ